MVCWFSSDKTRHSSKTWIFFNTFFVSFVSQSVKSYCRWLGVSNVGRVPLQSLTLLSPTLFRFLPFNTFSPYRLYRACSIDLDWIWEKYSEKETGKKGKEIANDFLVLTHEQKNLPVCSHTFISTLITPLFSFGALDSTKVFLRDSCSSCFYCQGRRKNIIFWLWQLGCSSGTVRITKKINFADSLGKMKAVVLCANLL